MSAAQSPPPEGQTKTSEATIQDVLNAITSSSKEMGEFRKEMGELKSSIATLQSEQAEMFRVQNSLITRVDAIGAARSVAAQGLRGPSVGARVTASGMAGLSGQGSTSVPPPYEPQPLRSRR